VSHPLAITFDFWNTLFWTGSTALQLRARRLAHGLQSDEDAVHSVLVEGFDRWQAEWQAGRNWGPLELAEMLLQRFIPRGRYAKVEDLAQLVEVAGIDTGERVVDGAVSVIDQLRGAGCRVGLISDTGFSRGRVLRLILHRAGLLHRFQPGALTFSDEVGVPKPRREIFYAALSTLAVPPDAAVHVGDLRATDVAGARAVGMHSVRFTGCHDDTGEGPEAETVVARLTDIPVALDLA
jgi:HAD superfamily hydrolase (TIGR01549 family)